MILKVSRLGHPVLRQKSTDLDVADIKAGRFKQLMNDMAETMAAYEGVGLAGPQVHLGSRIFVYAVDEVVAKRRGVPAMKLGVMFNATYEPIGEEKITDWEGCLSVPFLAAEVPRFRKILVRGIDGNGEKVEAKLEGYPARIFQHEIDHTDGFVYLDRLPDLRTLGYTIVL